MELSVLGRTGLMVSRMGVGLAEIGGLDPGDQDAAGQILNTALDEGVNFLDTAACYGRSEELIGLTVAHRRADYVLATKCGHSLDGDAHPAWTAEGVTASIERSLRRMKTDHLDLVQLHSCGLDVLQRGEVVDALLRAKEQGKTRFVGYSEPNRGDKPAAAWAVESGHFDTLQCSFNIVEQEARASLFPVAEEHGVGIIVKRPLAGAAWGAMSSPRPEFDECFERYRAMSEMGPLAAAPHDPLLLALNFVLAHPEADTAIVGTRNPLHMQENLQRMDQCVVLTQELLDELYSRYERMRA